MPFRPQHSLLKIDVDNMHTIDTRDVTSLFGMWAVFSKVSEAMEDGKRLENLSWRLWNRETFCCCPDAHPRSSPLSAKCKVSPRAARDEHIPLPALSSSVSSTESIEEEEDETLSPSPIARPELRRKESLETRSRGREKHITSIDLEKMVISIKEKKNLEPLSALSLPLTPQVQEAPATTFSAPADITPTRTATKPTLPTAPGTGAVMATTAGHASAHVHAPAPAPAPPPPTSAAVPMHAPAHSDVSIAASNALESSASTVGSNDSNVSEQPTSSDSSSTEMSTHNIVRGFTSSSYRSQTHLPTAQPAPILKTSPTYRLERKEHLAPPKKKGAMFTLGGSSEEDESSLDSHMAKNSASSLSNNMAKPPQKHTSFKDVAMGRAIQESPVFEESDEEDEDEDNFESVIEDDDEDDEDEDSSDWEDDVGEGADSSSDERSLFQRVDSRPNLTSRRSMLTTLMHEPDRARAMANVASRSTPALRRSRATSPNGPSATPSPHRRYEPQPPRNGPEASRPQPILMNSSSSHQLALSPRTTRRNMLSTELTESLRKNLLWERQHKSSNNLAAMKRRHTSTDVKNLRQQPDLQPVMSMKETDKKNLSNEYFHQGLGEYHQKGW